MLSVVSSSASHSTTMRATEASRSVNSSTARRSRSLAVTPKIVPSPARESEHWELVVSALFAHLGSPPRDESNSPSSSGTSCGCFAAHRQHTSKSSSPPPVGGNSAVATEPAKRGEQPALARAARAPSARSVWRSPPRWARRQLAHRGPPTRLRPRAPRDGRLARTARRPARRRRRPCSPRARPRLGRTAQELDPLGDHVEARPLPAVVGLPLVELEPAADRDLVALVEMLGAGPGLALEAPHVQEHRPVATAGGRPQSAACRCRCRPAR
jgi:hypothetical protein